MTQVVPVQVRTDYKTRSKNPLLQITIPKEIRDNYKIKQGDTLLIVGNGIGQLRIFTKEEYMRRFQ